jgi:hypothetical protein
LEFDHWRRELLDETLIALGRLNGASSFFPDTDLFLYGYDRYLALMSEGTSLCKPPHPGSP